MGGGRQSQRGGKRGRFGRIICWSRNDKRISRHAERDGGKGAGFLRLVLLMCGLAVFIDIDDLHIHAGTNDDRGRRVRAGHEAERDQRLKQDAKENSDMKQTIHNAFMRREAAQVKISGGAVNGFEEFFGHVFRRFKDGNIGLIREFGQLQVHGLFRQIDVRHGHQPIRIRERRVGGESVHDSRLFGNIRGGDAAAGIGGLYGGLRLIGQVGAGPVHGPGRGHVGDVGRAGIRPFGGGQKPGQSGGYGTNHLYKVP